MDGIKWPIIAIVATIFVICCDGLPTRSCPKYETNFYVPDTVNRCVYYWCLGGVFVEGALLCNKGTGVPPFYSSNRNPCRIKVKSCLKDRNDAVGTGRTASYRRPTQSMFTYHPTTTPEPEVTTDEMTTEIIDVTTEEEPEMTTDPVDEMTTEPVADMTTEVDDVMTEEPGSGDDDDVISETEGVYFDKSSEGGLSVTASTQDDCLRVCSMFMAVCWSIDWDDTASTCRIHISEPQCGALVDKTGNKHFRFRCS